MKKDSKLFKTEYGFFDADTSEYVITRPDTPKPWVNVICPGDYGLTISQTGGGYSWRTHAGLNRITRWDQDLISDSCGKYLYLRDDKSGAYWSAGWKPVCREPDFYECRHGFGYTTITSENEGIRSEWTLFVPHDAPVEIWTLKVTNRTRRARSLSAWTYMEWCLGEAPDSHREFHKTFIETERSKDKKTLLATKRLWTLSNAKGQHWNRSWDYVAWHGAGTGIKAMSGSKEAFIGQYGTVANPRALEKGNYLGDTTGKWDDGAGSIACRVSLKPGQSKTLVWTVGCADNRREALALSKRYQTTAAADEALKAAREFWTQWMDASRVSTPDDGFNLMADRWLKYQALSSRIWGRTAYYQTGGAYGYRDQLQDSQLFLHLRPDYTKRQILLHASRQYETGIVQHWWHPLSDKGLKSDYSDDLIWLPFVTVNYLKETGDFSILHEQRPYLDTDGSPTTYTGSLYEHCCRAIQAALNNRNHRGLPLIGVGDWNDGLSAAGWDGKGESVWVAQFLYGVMKEFAVAIERAIAAHVLSVTERERIVHYRAECDNLMEAVNALGWDGKWYWAASCDDGTRLGSHKSKECQIHLNPQTWAILNDMVPEARKKPLLQAVERMLYRDYGPLVLYPAYQTPDERVGYLTRYAAGVRENGGLYTHAGVWAVQMECYLKRQDKAWDLMKSFCPVYRGMKPDLYQCEPYVTPGNVDGPDSPLFGRGGWTWYTGSAAWLYRIMTEWILGVRPDWDGLVIDPCIPTSWKEFSIQRLYRGHTFHITVEKKSPKATEVESMTVDGKPVEGCTLFAQGENKVHQVRVVLK